MFIIFYNKTTSAILGFREDLSSPAPTAEHLLNLFLSDHKITDGSVESAVLFSVKLDDFDSGKYLYNATTNVVSDNLSYVPPASKPVTEPTSAT